MPPRIQVPTLICGSATLLACCVILSVACLAQQQTLGSIIGHIRVDGGGAPSDSVLVSLQVRGAPMDSVYSDSSGTFGFHSLVADPYVVIVNDDHYQPVQRSVTIDPAMLSPVQFVDIVLVPKSNQSASAPKIASGVNPNMVDIHNYEKRFPKAATKEFKKGLSADGSGRKDDAILHYQKAIVMAPDFYYAHNNLGSDYLSKSDFAAARKEFERVIELNQSDAAGYFNLSNVCMLSGQLSDAGKYLDEGIRRQPDSALGTFLRGSLDIRLGMLPEAEGNLRRAITLSPSMTEARLQLVNLFLKEGRKQDAKSQLQDFLGTFPDSPMAGQAKQILLRLESETKAQAPIAN